MKLHEMLVPFLALATYAPAAAQIAIYFNKGVDSTLASSPRNVARGGRDLALITATEIARARHAIDVAMYSLSHPAVVEALLAASRRGVRVRLIGERGNIDDGGSGFSTLAASGIPLLANPGAPEGEIQPLMHDKFLAIDARPGAPAGAEPTVITGSWNATLAQTRDDANNLLVIRDSALAAAYTMEFEEMWGGGGELPDRALARFGDAKRSNTPHDFLLRDGTRVELRFAPTDSTSRRINALLGGARHAIYTANLTFTYIPFARIIEARHASGVDVRSIIDNVNDQGSQFDILKGFADVYEWELPGLLHHKYAIIDGLPGDGPAMVITGSHNWTVSAETRNDENTLMIFSEAIANQYLQEFAMRYREVGGDHPFVSVGGVADETTGSPALSAHPIPFNERVRITAAMRGSERGEIVVADMMGRELLRRRVSAAEPAIVWETRDVARGIYFARLRAGERNAHLRLLLAR